MLPRALTVGIMAALILACGGGQPDYDRSVFGPSDGLLLFRGVTPASHATVWQAEGDQETTVFLGGTTGGWALWDDAAVWCGQDRPGRW